MQTILLSPFISQDIITGTIHPTGANHQSAGLSRQRSQSMPVIDTRWNYPPGNNNRHSSPASQMPPNYNLVLQHPSIYKKKEVATRQSTLPPPPHYDDLRPLELPEVPRITTNPTSEIVSETDGVDLEQRLRTTSYPGLTRTTSDHV